MIAYRQRFKLNQAKAAEIAGVTPGAWLRLETMKFKEVSVKTIDKIADALGVHPNVIAPPEIRGEHLKWAETVFVDMDAEHLLENIGNPQLLSHQVEISPPQLVDDDDVKEELSKVLRTLTYREREILKLRFGIGAEDGRTFTLEEVGKIFMVSSNRVRQVQDKAIRKLQHPVRAEKLAGFLDNAEIQKLPESKSKIFSAHF